MKSFPRYPINLVVFGANGWIGKQFVRYARKRGYKMLLVTRQETISFEDDQSIKLSEFLDGELSKFEFSDSCCVLNLIGKAHAKISYNKDVQKMYIDSNVRLPIEIATKSKFLGLKKFIHLSSLKVYGSDQLRKIVTGKTKEAPTDIYGKTKLQGEDAIKEIYGQNQNLSWTVIRPPLVYGPNVKGNLRSFEILAQIPLPIPLGGIENKRSLIFIENLCDFILFCIDQNEADGRCWLVADEQTLAVSEIFSLITSNKGSGRAKIVKIPPIIQSIMRQCSVFSYFESRLFSDSVLDPSTTYSELSWKPKVGLTEGFRKSFSN